MNGVQTRARTHEKARLIALSLAARFRAERRFVVAPHSATVPAALVGDSPYIEATSPFAELAVQAVGHTEGENAEPRVAIYVVKASRRDLSKLPGEIDGVPVVVRRIGAVTIKPEFASGSGSNGRAFRRGGRIACGGSCAPGGVGYAGTIGALVTNASNALHMLSNNHVLGDCNYTLPGQPILWPANPDQPGAQVLPETIATHAEIAPFRMGHPQFVPPCDIDAAIAAIVDPDRVSSWQGDDDGYDTPPTVIEPASDMKVKKTGRSTGLTTGDMDTIVDEPTPIPFQSSDKFRGVVYFRNFWYAMGDEGAFATQGDSGSLVVTADGTAAVGLLFATNRTGDFGAIIPLSRILGEFGGLTLVSDHNA